MTECLDMVTLGSWAASGNPLLGGGGFWVVLWGLNSEWLGRLSLRPGGGRVEGT
jgi:hypothetical protein